MTPLLTGKAKLRIRSESAKFPERDSADLITTTVLRNAMLSLALCPTITKGRLLT